MKDYQGNILVRVVIGLLALADGVIHFSLDFVLFRGNLFGSPFPSGPRPGGAPPPGPRANPLILPLNQLFVLNLVGAVVLVLFFWFVAPRLGARRWLMNLALIVYEAAGFLAWWSVGRPNPMGLGYLSKTIELLLIVILVVYTFVILRSQRRMASREPAQVS